MDTWQLKHVHDASRPNQCLTFINQNIMLMKMAMIIIANTAVMGHTSRAD
jgi:hypothetical protein